MPTERPMIIVTRLHGPSLAVNCDLIERVEATPDTVTRRARRSGARARVGRTPGTSRGGLMEERIVVADPVGDPQGYQRELLALLGTSDPLEVMAATLATFRRRTAGLAAEAVERRPAPREWSVAELLGHLWDAEIAYAFRARAILAQDRPALIGYDQDAWATLARPPFRELLAAFGALTGGQPGPGQRHPGGAVGTAGHPRGAGADQLPADHRDRRRPRPGPPAPARADDRRHSVEEHRLAVDLADQGAVALLVVEGFH